MHTDSLIEKLKKQGLRITPIRKQIIAIFSQKNIPPLSVTDLLKIIVANKTTLYREIETLKKYGYLTELDFGDTQKRYELATREHHHHLVCMKCKSITDVDIADDFSKQETIIAHNEQFKVLKHTLEFFGICSSCQ